MALTIVLTDDERLVGGTVERALREAMAEGSATLLVPSFTQALQAQKALAHKGGLSLGVEVGTPAAWARDRWDVWGDGRQAVNAATRALLMEAVVPEALDTPGTVKLLCGLAERYLYWLCADKLPTEVLTGGERNAVALLGDYARVLVERGRIEGSEIMALLPSVLEAAGVAVGGVVLSGFDEMGRAERTLVTGLARCARVTLVARAGDTAATEEARSLVAELERQARAEDVSVSCVREQSGVIQERASELDALLGVLFEPGAGRLEPAQAVRLVEPAGPVAEAELVAREVDALRERGMRSVAIAVCDGQRAWRELVPKLVQRGHTVSARLVELALSIPVGRAFMAYARTVALLSELDVTWPAAADSADGPLVRLGDMSWWAPSAITDFLLMDVAQVSPQNVWALDAQWRANRLLAPADVLSQLTQRNKTSDVVERATRELLRGRLGSAASRLLDAYAPGGVVEGEHDLACEEAVQALAAVIGVAGTLRELGVGVAAVGSSDAAPGQVPTDEPGFVRRCSLSQLVSYAERVLGDVRLSLRPCVRGASGVMVDIVGRGDACQAEPGSYDALILCGLTSDKMPVPVADDALTGIACALGLEGTPNPLRRERARFARMVAVPRRALLLERPLFSAQGQPTYPAVLLGELTRCYGDALPRTGLSETPAAAAVRASGRAPKAVAAETVAASGQLDATLACLVTVPAEGSAELPGGLPLLSASQLESYLECPLKWFSLRRLRLSDCDAGFGPLEMGTFVHRVLELTYAELAGLGWSHTGVEGEVARKVLKKNFDEHRVHQYLLKGSRPGYQALVAHSVSEEAQYDRLLRDLTTVIDYQTSRLQGFEPRYFEWEFGRGDEWVEYAGARVTGTVDRIDVNAHGQALVIDYKHKGPGGFFGEYAVFGKDGREAGSPLELPRRIQALMYAQVVRRAFPDLEVVGAVYLGTRGSHELSGAVAHNHTDLVFGPTLSNRRLPQVSVPADDDFGTGGAERGMQALLDAVEAAVAGKVELLRAGNVSASPVDAKACQYCPVSNCGRRMA